MTDEDDRLRALFDATTEEPSQAELDRMARAAAQIPGRKPARAWLTWPRLVAALVGVAAVAGALAIGLDHQTPPQAPIAHDLAPPEAVAPEAPAPREAPPTEDRVFAEDGLAIVTDDSAWSEEELDASWVATIDGDPLAALDGDDPLDALDVFLAFDDDDLDVLLASYERTLIDG